VPIETDQERIKFYLLLQHICTRPTLFLGATPDLDQVCAWLRGYSRAFANARGRWSLIGGWPLLDNFEYWVMSKYSVNHPAWSFAKILLHFNDHNQKKAIEAIPDLFKDYLSSQPPECWETLYGRLQDQMVVQYGNTQYAPSCNLCNNDLGVD